MDLRGLKPIFEEDDLISDVDSDQIQLNIFYENFERDFVKDPFKVKGKSIKIFSGKSKIEKYAAYAESFVHIVTRDYKSQPDRLFEPQRANRIHWIKPILLAYPNREIFFFKWKNDRGICLEHYWLYAKDFMVVLKEINPTYQIVTAFCVDYEEKINFYELYKDYKDGKGYCPK